MWELFQHIDCGQNVQEIIETEACKIMRLHDESGDGMMTVYHVFPGVILLYNDFHMKECVSQFQTDVNLFLH